MPATALALLCRSPPHSAWLLQVGFADWHRALLHLRRYWHCVLLHLRRLKLPPLPLHSCTGWVHILALHGAGQALLRGGARVQGASCGAAA